MIRAPHLALLPFLEEMIDYAGLFPPAALAAEATRDNFARYLTSPHRFALGRLVWPASRLSELPVSDWPVSALLTGVEELPAVLEYNRLGGRCDAVELRWHEAAADAFSSWGYWAFFEVTAGEAERAAQALAGRSTFALKLRCGGLSAEAFPEAETLWSFVDCCQRHKKAYKFTAGLHHALRGHYRLAYTEESPCAAMWGFFSLFLACALRPQLNLESWTRLLHEEDPSAFHWDECSLGWEKLALTGDELRRFRSHGLRSFGSCSFEEPITELQLLGWLQ